MSDDQKRFQDDKKSPGNVKGGSEASRNVAGWVDGNKSADDDIIELVDVVREGQPPQPETKDHAPLLDEEPEQKKEEGGELIPPDFNFETPEPIELIGEDVSGGSDEDLELAMAEHADEEPEQKREEGGELIPPDFDFEAPDTIELTGEDVPGSPGEDLDQVMAGLVDQEVEPEPFESPPPESLPISQEKLEAALAGVITPVVERVVRETVAEVAERVIREAIESLRESLDSTPE